jgi:hypothetical protein
MAPDCRENVLKRQAGPPRLDDEPFRFVIEHRPALQRPCLAAVAHDGADPRPHVEEALLYQGGDDFVRGVRLSARTDGKSSPDLSCPVITARVTA